MNNKNNFNNDSLSITLKLFNITKAPFYLFFEKTIEENINIIKQSFSNVLNFKIFYSIKSNFENLVINTIKNCGCGFDVSCPLDLYISKKHSIPSEHLVIDNFRYFHQEAQSILSSNVHMIHIESLKEAELIQIESAKLNKKTNIGIRINIPFNHFDPIRLWFELSQRRFGLPLANLYELVLQIKSFPNINIKSLFTHTSLPFPTEDDYIKLLKTMFKTAILLKKHNINIEELNIGGGFPNSSITYFSELPYILRKFLFVNRIKYKLENFNMMNIASQFLKLSQKYNFYPTLAIEPGTFILDNAAVLCGSVISKNKFQIETDLSLNDLAFKFPFKNRGFIIPEKMNYPKITKTDIIGPTCNPYDVLFRKASLPLIEIGDKIIIFNVGAYSIPRSIQHICPRKPVYYVTKSDNIIKIREKESFNDIIFKQI